MNATDEAGHMMLVQGVPFCNQLHEREEQQVRKESVLSIAQSARRAGSAVVVVGPQNLRIVCEVCPQKPSGLRWHVDGHEVPASKVSHLLDVAQQE